MFSIAVVEIEFHPMLYVCADRMSFLSLCFVKTTFIIDLNVFSYQKVVRVTRSSQIKLLKLQNSTLLPILYSIARCAYIIHKGSSSRT